MTSTVPERESHLGYRSLFSVSQDQEPDVVGAVMAQLHSWLRGKRYDVDAMRIGEQTTISAGVDAALYRIEDRDGSVTFQAALREQRREGDWGTKVIVYAPARRTEDATVLLEISGPFKPATPNLAKLLTGALPAKDSHAQLRDQPLQVRGEDVDDLLEVVCDPDRRGLIFVAGMDDTLPFDQWRQYVERLLAPSAGLAGSYFLGPEATEQFRRVIGESHRVDPGTIRTFLPAADPASDLDAQRHRILTSNRIVRESSGRLGHLLRDRARDEVLRAELPARVRRLQRRVADHVDSLLLAPVEPVSLRELIVADDPASSKGSVQGYTQEVPGQREIDAAAADSDLHLTPQPIESPLPDETATVPVRNRILRTADRAIALAKAVLRTSEPTDEEWDRIATWTVLGQGAEATQARVRQQLSSLRDDITELESSRAELRSQLEGEQLEHSEALAEVDEFRRRNSYLEGKLRESDRSAEIYGESPESHRNHVEDFEELLFFASELEHIEITADEKIVLSLVEYDPQGEWARKVWTVLGALEDYAAASGDGRCSTDVDGYLRNTPDGCRGYSANKHAATESEVVRTNSKYSSARTLRVPKDVAAAGSIAMMARFKIAQFGMVSPRLHYYDDTARSGKVYIGYIGPHLPTKSSN